MQQRQITQAEQELSDIWSQIVHYNILTVHGLAVPS
jgi:hypothetical protein